MSPGVTDGAVGVGATGTSWRSSVSPWGAVTPLDGSGSAVEWYVAADDRWHVPAEEAAVRQRRLDGTPVVETRMRVPDGDAVQRVWSVPDAGGLTVIEVENESPLPFAVAFAGRRVLTERPPAGVPVQGIDLPADAIVLPVGHRSMIRVAVPAEPTRIRASSLPRLAPALAVVRGWLSVVHRASRILLPDIALGEAVVAARCDLLLAGPTADDTCGFLLDVAELGRLGDGAETWLPEVVDPIAAIAKSTDADADAALIACERLAVQAGDDRAAGDIARLRARRRRVGIASDGDSRPSSFSEIGRGRSVGRFVTHVEQRIADGGRLLPGGLPYRWLGADFEVHGVPTGPRSTIGFAVRWHGDRPAVLWEQRGEPVRLSAPGIDAHWATDEEVGEALWAAPPRPTRLGVSIDVGDP